MAESATEIKLFGKWSLDDVEINDISLVVSETLDNLGEQKLRLLSNDDKWSDVSVKRTV